MIEIDYDANGNLINDGGSTYAWNARNQLSRISSVNISAAFGYDQAGRRVGTQINGAPQQFLFDGANVVQQQNAGKPK